MPKISVIVPVYGVEPCLRRCLDSIVSQTYRNLEIILVDDGSPDGCGAICDGYASRDGRVQVIHKPNGGVSSARNAGLAAASGEWIGWVDADDWIEPDMYAYLLGLAQAHQGDIVQCGIFFDDNGSTQLRFVPDRTVILHKRIDELKEEHLALFSNSVYTKLYRAEILRGLAFDTAYPVGEDLLFHLHTLSRAFCMVLAPQARYHYVQRRDSVCNAPPTPERFMSYRRVLEKAARTFRAYPSICGFLKNERLRNDLDMCSRIIRSRLRWTAAWEREILSEIKRELWYILTGGRFTGKEKFKFAAIAFCWPVYRRGLPVWKRLSAPGSKFAGERKNG